ncbi:MAG: primosomal protein N' [Acidobacteriota bacterium]
MTLYADVVLPLPLDQPYTYIIPPDAAESIAVGSRVLVPLGQRWQTGFVVALRKRRPAGRLNLKPVREVLDEKPLFSSALLSFAAKLGRSCFTPWGEILQAAVPPSFLVKSRAGVFLRAKGKEALETGLLSEEEKQVAVSLVSRPHSPRFLQRKSGGINVSALLARMRKKDLVGVSAGVKRVRRKTEAGEAGLAPAQLELDFSWDENLERAAAVINQAMAKKAFSTFLLFGSGARREAVYFRLIKDALAGGGRVLFLIPEISLTSALVEKIEKKIGEDAALLHSQMTEKRRELEWQKIRNGQAEVVVGPRSALFAPLDRLRLIILDEEQDESYSPQEGLAFDVRRAARLRAEEEKAVLVCGSALPLVESFYQAEKSGYLVEVGGKDGRARVSLTDCRRELGLVCPEVKRSIARALGKKRPVILFFNRRGYAASLLCPRCAFVPRCDRCDMALSYHKKEERLVCHACQRSMPASMTCPLCRSRLTLRRGAGIEAVAEELRKDFPGRRVEIFAADEAGRKPERETLLRAFSKGGIDILVGTQLLAHQSGLPAVFLVGVIYPEMVLHLADFRSGQKAYQAISRALRFVCPDDAAEAIIQTAAPDHHSIREAARGDYRAFYEKEIKYRRLLDYPPFSCLAEVFFRDQSLRRAAGAARTFAAEVRKLGGDVQVFGPSLARVARVRRLHRVQVSLRARRAGIINKILVQTLRGIRSRRVVFIFS